ncbi:LTA synthase family protein [Paenibacillus sp. J31TS4]|uniref:LTA synthase family protein n=1 Tax=Paenibacillus sp. J31TS4 TaxID=2807195 RepID=UPI001BD1492A|nr:LTA synthase family protein [Paenibacillus sp. J31TS4]
MSWVKHHPNEFFLNYIFYFALFFLFISLIGRTRWSYWILSVFFLIVSLISGIKFKLLGLPLLPWDIVLSSEGTDVAQYLGDIVQFEMIAGLLLFLLCSYVVVHRLPFLQSKFRWPERIFLFVLSGVLLASLYSNKPLNLKNAMNISTIPWDQAANYTQNGFLLSSLYNMDLIFIKEPEGYSKETIQQLIDGIQRKNVADNGVKPNVIVMLSEAFWDPTQIKSIKFDKDPLEYLHSLQKDFTHGTLLSPQFGGGTANVEYEVLSGHSNRFLPQGSLAYIQYVNHRVDSLAGILGRQNYHTAAVNPLDNWFFDSNKVYRNFGFSKFISSEFFPSTPDSMFIPDTEVSKIIISEAEKSQGPDFIFANTMENHWPYYAGKFPENEFKVESLDGSLSTDTKAMLETLAQGVHNAEKSLKLMIDHFSTTKEPTIIVFFGDHLPLLGNDYQAYRETKFLQDNDPDVLNKLYSTPFLIWNNYLPKEQKEELHMSPSFLSPYVLNMANLKGTYYTDYLFDLYKKIPVIPPENYLAGMNIADSDLRTYKLLQHDSMFGEQYGYSGIGGDIIDHAFVLGFGPIEVNGVEETQTVTAAAGAGVGSGERTLAVKGNNFVPKSVVYLNGKPLPTTYYDEHTLHAILPKDAKPGKQRIDVRVLDSKKIVLNKSNSFDRSQ